MARHAKASSRRNKTPGVEIPARRPTGQNPSLADPAAWVKGWSKSLGERLARLNIESVYDLITHYPRNHVMRRPIAKLKHGETQSVAGRVVSVGNRVTPGRRMRLVEVVIDDAGAQIALVFFNQPWITRRVREGMWLSAVGMVEFSYGEFTLKPSSWNMHDTQPWQSGDERLIPEYPLTEKLSNNMMTALVRNALESHGRLLPTVLPPELARELKLMPEAQAIHEIHFPESEAHLTASKLALKFREFYLLEAGLALRHKENHKPDGELIFKIDSHLRGRCDARFPFKFTKAQARVIDELCADLASPGRMNRLLQGDVGSGKTAVALYAMLLAVGNGHQVALLAPTEILARQHHTTITNYLRGSKVRTELLLGNMETNEREELLAGLASGDVHIVIGTHALLQPDVRFARLALIVIDEQHKFGVRQREQFAVKGKRPHRLAMSATPIPRTLSLTLYGDLDLSIIDEMPPSRTPVKTSLVPIATREKNLADIHRRLKEGQQAYFIYPLVEPNPQLELKSATELYENLKPRFADVGVALIHGQMPGEDKALAMTRFHRGDVKALIATVVVEVGVDVPAANIMVIEHAERFGLAQLHQLRGRIGRGGGQSYLYLFAEATTDAARERLETICRTTDGFEIAEADMRMRGYGDFIGTRQAGMPKLKLGDPVADLKILARARKEAFARVDTMDIAKLRETLMLEFGRSFRFVDA